MFSDNKLHTGFWGWVVFMFVGTFFTTLGFFLGSIFLNFVRPDAYFTSGAMDSFKKRIFWSIGPQFIGWCIGLYVSMNFMGNVLGYEDFSENRGSTSFNRAQTQKIIAQKENLTNNLEAHSELAKSTFIQGCTQPVNPGKYCQDCPVYTISESSCACIYEHLPNKFSNQDIYEYYKLPENSLAQLNHSLTSSITSAKIGCKFETQDVKNTSTINDKHFCQGITDIVGENPDTAIQSIGKPDSTIAQEVANPYDPSAKDKEIYLKYNDSYIGYYYTSKSDKYFLTSIKFSVSDLKGDLKSLIPDTKKATEKRYGNPDDESKKTYKYYCPPEGNEWIDIEFNGYQNTVSFEFTGYSG